jgi:hypothetical protein
MRNSGFGDLGSGFRVQGSDLWFMFKSSRDLRVSNFGFMMQGSRFRGRGTNPSAVTIASPKLCRGSGRRHPTGATMCIV